jgi:hypothetical protein
MKKQSLNMLKKSDGVALIELAITLPILLLLVFGVFEYARAIHAKNIITNMSREAANLASRTSSPVQQIMDSIALTAQPLDMTANGMIFVTEVRGQGADPTVPRVTAQYRWTGSSYQPRSRAWSSCSNWDANGACLENFDELSDNEAEADLNGLELKDREVVFAVEVFLDYQPITTYVINDRVQLYSLAVF